MPDTKKRILIFDVNWLGDVLFSTPVIRAVRENYPGSYIACVIPARCAAVLKDNPRLDEIIFFDERKEHRGVIAKFRFIRALKAKKFDTVFLLHRSMSRALICWCAGIPERIGYTSPKRGFLLTKKLAAPDIKKVHRIDYYLDVARQAGLAVKERAPELFIAQKDDRAIDDFLKNNAAGRERMLIGIHPGGNWGPKRWNKEYFSKTADALMSNYKAGVIITGSAQEKDLAEGIASAMRQRPVVASGKLTLGEFAALCKRLDLFISADSGPLHIAHAAGAKKVIALFGPTDPLLTGPMPQENVTILKNDIGCSVPCYKVDCQDNRCMKAITPEDVLAEVEKMLSH